MENLNIAIYDDTCFAIPFDGKEILHVTVEVDIDAGHEEQWYMFEFYFHYSTKKTYYVENIWIPYTMRNNNLRIYGVGVIEYLADKIYPEIIDNHLVFNPIEISSDSLSYIDGTPFPKVPKFIVYHNGESVVYGDDDEMDECFNNIAKYIKCETHEIHVIPIKEGGEINLYLCCDVSQIRADDKKISIFGIDFRLRHFYRMFGINGKWMRVVKIIEVKMNEDKFPIIYL